MRTYILSANCLLALAATALGWNHAASDVFKQTVDDNGLVLVAFVAPSEAKSQALEKEWTIAVENAREPVISVDCSADSAVCESNDVKDHPIISVFKKGEPSAIIYQGPRRAHAMLRFVDRFKRPTVSDVAGDSLAGFKVTDETVFIGYINEGDETARKAFEEVASNHRNEFSFGVVSDPYVIEDQKLKSPTIVCYKLIDRDSKALPSFEDAESLEKLVLEASRPLVGELTPANHQRFLNRGWPMVYLFGENEKQRAELRINLAKMAQSYFDSLTIVTVDPFYFPGLQAKLGMEPGVFPGGAVHQLSNDRIYPYPKGRPYDARHLQQWGLDVYQGKVKPWTPPGVTTTFEHLGPTKVATRRVSINAWGGANIKIGRDEL